MTPLEDLGEEIRDWLEAHFPNHPINVDITTDVKAFVVSLVNNHFGEAGVRKITPEVTE